MLRFLSLLALLCPLVSDAAALRLCVDVHPHPPFLMPDGSGTVGVVVAQAARSAGFSVEHTSVPLKRCEAEVARGTLHGFPMTPYLPARLPFLVYPMRGKQVDAQRATVGARQMLYRVAGSPVKWDGERIEGLDGALLVVAGSVAMVDKMQALGVPVDANARSLEVNFAKLLAGRGGAAVGFENEARELLAQPAMAGRIEALPIPVTDISYYLAVSDTFYKAHRSKVEKMWDEVGRLNQAAKTLKK